MKSHFRIAQLSDFHFTHVTWNPFKLFPKRFFGQMNWLLSRNKNFAFSNLQDLPSLFSKMNIDLVVLGGDFTTSSLHQEFSLAKTFIETLNLPWIAIPGNHDQYTRRSFIQKRYYRYFKNKNAAFYSLEKDGIEAHRIAPHWWLIALDTTHATKLSSSQGFFSEKQENTLEELFNAIPQNDSIILLNHYPFFQHGSPKHCLMRGEALESLIKEHSNIVLYLHGHTHQHIMADLQKSNLPILLDAGSCTQTQNSWNLIDLTEKGCTVTAYQHINPVRTENYLWMRK